MLGKNRIQRQRIYRRDGKLKDEQIEKLNAIGMVWNVEKKSESLTSLMGERMDEGSQLHE